MTERAVTTTRRWLHQRLIAAGGGALGGALAAACGSATSPDSGTSSAASKQPASLEVWFFHDQWAEAFQQVIALYRTKNPAVTVDFPALAGTYSQKIIVALTSGAGPDLMSVNWDWVRMWSEQGYLFDLTSEAAKDKAFAKDLSAYHPKLQANMKWKDKQRGVGLDHDDIGVYWNVTLFNQAQVPPLTQVQDKWTWNDLLDMARKLTKPEIQQYGFFGQNASGQTGWWSFVFGNGGKVLTDDFTKADPVLQPPAVEAIQWLADARLKQGVSPGPQQMQAAVGSTSYVNMFSGGKLAMMIDGSWRLNAYLTSIKDFEWDVAHMPLVPRTGKRASILHGTGFGVNQAGKSIDASIAFVKHLATRDTHKVYGSTGIIQSARVDEWDGFYSNPKPPAHRSVLKAIVDYAEPYLATGQWGIDSFTSFVPLNTAMTRIYEGQVAPRAGLEDGVREYNTKLAELVARVKK